ncbi:hypothetical protein FBU59_005376 [Linderina macrospora]|uniref:Uncharacterized protein n=1 Tax=Linderina macrospora TaxID=4868 RepID=A0ACC1J2Z6_9FUNG|nr:hypothetical protein FBU59_005376 [Linderina macrospora]
MHLTAFDQRHLNHDSAIRLIIKSSQTLEYLRIGSVRPSELQKIVSGATGEVVFPRMRECLLTLNVDDSRLKQFNIAQPHFPALEFLHIAIPPSDISPEHETTLSIFEHTFLADLFFFGPRTQLRVLNFPLAWDTVEVLSTNVLANAQELLFPTISMENEHVLDNEESNQIMQACLAVRGLRTFCIDSICPQPCLPMIPQCGELGMFCAPSYAFSIDQICTLLAHLPNLYYFQCELALDCPESVTLSYPHKSMLRFMLYIPFRPTQLLSECIFGIVSQLPQVLQVRLPFSLCGALCDRIEQEARESTYPWSRRIYENACIVPNSSQ